MFIDVHLYSDSFVLEKVGWTSTTKGCPGAFTCLNLVLLRVSFPSRDTNIGLMRKEKKSLYTKTIYSTTVKYSDTGPKWSHPGLHRLLKVPITLWGKKKSQKYVTTHTNMSRRNEVKTFFRFRLMTLWILIFLKKFAQEETRYYEICDVIYGTKVCRVNLGEQGNQEAIMVL